MSRNRTRLTALPLVLAAVATLSAAPIDAAASNLKQARATAASDAAHPFAMQRAAAAVASAPKSGLQPFTPATVRTAVTAATTSQREVFGFALASSLADATVGYPSWNFSLLTTVAFFGIHVQDDGTFANDSGMSVWNSSQMTGLLNAAHATGARVVLTIILQDFSSGTPHMCAGLAHASTAIANTVAAVNAKGVDGVNVDFEGLNGSCGTTDPNWARHAMTAFVGNLRAALPQGSYLSVDTYASSASDPVGFFDVPGLAQPADSLFVMAYDLEYSNYAHSPPGCSSFCLGPTAPLAGYYYNDTTTASQYISAVPASKVILGVPYYGRKSCVGSSTPNAYPTSAVSADSYLDAAGESSSNLVQPGTYVAHYDANDPTGKEQWDTWVNTSLNCTRELYFDDSFALGQKYALINSDNLRGVGIWTLNYGGGASELWATINAYFACPVSIGTAASQAATEFNVTLSTAQCAANRFDLEMYDSTTSQGWYALPVSAASGSQATATIDGYRGHTYQLRARAHSGANMVGLWSNASTTVPTTATLSHPFSGLYTLDGWGGVHGDSSAPLAATAYWPGWNIARAAHAQPGANAPQGGLVLDGWGGLHPYGSGITSLTQAAYWPNWDIARDFAFMPDGSGGFELDGWGGLHAFHVNGSTNPLSAQITAYWPNWDIARKVVIFPDGTGGYVLDGWGGVHAFGINGPAPAATTKLAQTGYWPNWNIARDLVLVPGNGNHSGYVLDGWGGVHPFHPSGDGSVMPAVIANVPYWPNWDIARGLWFLPGSATAGYTLDGWGGLHPFGGAPQLINTPYWQGWDIAIAVWGA